MYSFTTDQKIALLVVPVLLFGVLGISSAAAYGRNLTDEERVAIEAAHDLREAGEYERAREVLEKAGLLQKGRGMGYLNPKRIAMQDAITANDYAAFHAAVEGTPFADTVSEETFATLVKAHALRESGDIVAARKLLDESGIMPLAHPPYSPWKSGMSTFGKSYPRNGHHGGMWR